MERKGGTLTIAVGLIAFGAILLLERIGLLELNVFEFLLPLLIILFGLEVIYWEWRRRSTGESVRYNGWPVVALVFLLFVFVQGVGFVGARHVVGNVQGNVVVGDDVRRVEIRVPNAQIVVQAVTGQEVTYNGKLFMPTSEADRNDGESSGRSSWQVRQMGDTLYMEHRVRPHFFDFFRFWNEGAPYLEVSLPEHLATSIQTSNGVVSVQDMRADSNVRTSNGSVTIRNVHGDVDVMTSNGAVMMANITGRVNARTSNGRIEADSPITGSWRLTTSNGSITLRTQQGTDARVRAQTSNGRLGGNVPWQYEGSRNNRGSAVIGNGEHDVELRTSNGSIEVTARNN